MRPRCYCVKILDKNYDRRRNSAASPSAHNGNNGFPRPFSKKNAKKKKNALTSGRCESTRNDNGLSQRSDSDAAVEMRLSVGAIVVGVGDPSGAVRGVQGLSRLPEPFGEARYICGTSLVCSVLLMFAQHRDVWTSRG